MTKLLNAYRASPTVKNAEKLRAYDRKHPFAAICISLTDLAVFEDAMRLLDTTRKVAA